MVILTVNKNTKKVQNIIERVYNIMHILTGYSDSNYFTTTWRVLKIKYQ